MIGWFLFGFVIVFIFLLTSIFSNLRIFYITREDKSFVNYFKRMTIFLITLLFFVIGVNDFIYQRYGDEKFRTVNSFIDPVYDVEGHNIKLAKATIIEESNLLLVLDLTSLEDIQIDEVLKQNIKSKIKVDFAGTCDLTGLKSPDLLLLYSLRQIADYIDLNKKNISVYAYTGVSENPSIQRFQSIRSFTMETSLLVENTEKNSFWEELSLTIEGIKKLRENLKRYNLSITTHIDDLFDKISFPGIKTKGRENLSVVIFSDFVHEVVKNKHEKNDIEEKVFKLNNELLKKNNSLSIVNFPTVKNESEKQTLEDETVIQVIKEKITGSTFNRLDIADLKDVSFQRFEHEFNLSLPIKIERKIVNYDPNHLKLVSHYNEGEIFYIQSINSYISKNKPKIAIRREQLLLDDRYLSDGFRLSTSTINMSDKKAINTGYVTSFVFIPSQFISATYLFLALLSFSCLASLTALINLFFITLINYDPNSLEIAEKVLSSIFHIILFLICIYLLYSSYINYDAFLAEFDWLKPLLIMINITISIVPYLHYNIRS